MPSFPIKHIARRGPNEEGRVLFLESLPLDYKKAIKRQAILGKKHPEHDIVLLRTSRFRSRGGGTKFFLKRLGHNPGNPSRLPRRQKLLNYVLYAVSQKGRPQLLREQWSTVIGICHDHGQPGDPTIGGKNVNRTKP